MHVSIRKAVASLLSGAMLASAAVTGGGLSMTGLAADEQAGMSYLKGDVSSTVSVNSIAGSAETSAQEGKRMLFDHKIDTKFATATAPSADTPITVSFTIFYEEAIANYALVSADGSEDMDPKSWTLSGRNADADAWTVIDSQENQSFSQRGERKVYAVSQPTAYSQYKLDITANNGSTSGTQLAELQIATGEDVDLHLTWPESWGPTTTEGTPQDWAVNATEEVKAETLEAFNIAYNRLLDEGYNIGREKFGGTPCVIGAWSNYLNVQCEGSFNDNTGDPWNMNRKWGMLVAARPGVVFAVKGNLAKTYAPSLIAYGNEVVWTDPATGDSHIYQVFNGNTTVKKNLDGSDAGWPSYAVGTNAPTAVQTAMEEAYIQSGWDNDSFGGPYNLGFPAAAAQQDGDIWFQEFFGNDSAGASPQADRNGDYGISYLVASADDPDAAYIVTDAIMTAWASTWQDVDSNVQRFAMTGAPIGDQYTDEDGNTVQEFEKARIEISKEGETQILYSTGHFESFDLSSGGEMENYLSEGDQITILAKDGADLTQIAFDYTLCDGAACDIPSGKVQDFTNPVSYTITSYDGTETTYTVSVVTRADIPEADKEAAAIAAEAIDALPETVYLNHKEQVAAADDTYDNLSPMGRLLVPEAQAQKLSAAVARINILDTPIRVTCVGDSITEGVGGSAGMSYPDQMQKLLGSGYEIFNAGVSATNIIKQQGDVGQGTTFPYWTTAKYTQGKEFNPDIAIIMLGTNDASTRNWVQSGIENIRQVFKEDYRSLVREYKELGAYVIIALPTTCYGGWSERTPNLENDIIPALYELAEEENTGLVDMHSFTANHRDWFPDDLHPNNTSYGYFAAEFAKYVTEAAQKVTSDRLADLQAGGQTIEDFDPDTFQYEIQLEEEEEIPEISASAAFEGAEVVCTQADDNGIATVTVTSADGRYQQVYTLHFQQAGIPGTEILPGDLDNDEEVTIADVMEACKVMARESAGTDPTDDEIARGDLDDDGEITIADVMEICKILARQG